MDISFVFANGVSLKYVLNDTVTARNWLDMMKKVHPHHMSRSEENHRHGFASKELIEAKIDQLAECCATLGMPKVELSSNDWQNWQSNLNAIHATFPDILRSGVNNQLAHTSNLLIHWIEYELANFFDNAEQYLFNLDFNHYPETYNLAKEIPANEFNYFSTDIDFGVLNLHYIYIGRHFLEMYNAWDVTCPIAHFRPQWHHNATCAINFSEHQPQELLNEKMQQFYKARGGLEFFGLDYNHPRMAKGFFKLGQLENLHEYTFERREEMRNLLKESYVTHWVIE